MRVEITHTTRLDYSADVVEEVMDTRLGPLSDTHQRWDRFELRVSPPAAVRRYADGAGNSAHLITIVRPHRFVEVIASGEVDTLLANPFERPETAPPPLGPADLNDYLSASPLVPASDGLAAMASKHRPNAPVERFDAVRALMQLIYSEFTYQQNVTGTGTTVAVVLESRTGVCQDFAHVLIGLCRAIDVPARYVSGYIVVSEQAQSQRLGTMSQSQRSSGPERGGGASHAWIEAYTPTHGWRGFDPTNNLVASESHVKMAIGRDYSDVPPTRGTFRGNAEEKLTVEVIARRLA